MNPAYDGLVRRKSMGRTRHDILCVSVTTIYNLSPTLMTHNYIKVVTIDITISFTTMTEKVIIGGQTLMENAECS